MSKHYVFLMFGYPGSGKSFVSEWLVPRFNAVYLRADAGRLRMFGEDRPELYTPENRALVNNALNYACDQILQSQSASIVFDANFNRQETRQRIADVARANNVMPIVVWVKTPEDVAEERIDTRAKTTGHVIFESGIIQRMLKEMQSPGKGEHAIVLSGQQSAEQQQADFAKQLAELESK